MAKSKANEQDVAAFLYKPPEPNFILLPLKIKLIIIPYAYKPDVKPILSWLQKKKRIGE